MAKPKKLTLPPPVVFVPPPVTKEDAGEPMYGYHGATPDRSFNTGHPHGGIYPDGFDGGQELPDDIHIDRMVFPHSESEAERSAREQHADREDQAMAFRDKEFGKSRCFDIRPGSATGKQPGPRGLFDDD